MPEPMPEQRSDEKLNIVTTDITVVIIIFLLVFTIFGVYVEAILNYYRALLDWFYSADWQRIKKILTIVFGIIDALLLWFIIFTLRRISKLKETLPKKEAEIHPVLAKDEVKESWEQIRRLANSINSSEWNMAILRADGLLYDILKHKGYEGETMADCLKIVDPAELKSVENIWSAHRLRNMIAHDPTTQQTRETIIHALRSYENAFKDLGMLEEI